MQGKIGAVPGLGRWPRLQRDPEDRREGKPSQEEGRPGKGQEGHADSVGLATASSFRTSSCPFLQGAGSGNELKRDGCLRGHQPPQCPLPSIPGKGTEVAKQALQPQQNQPQGNRSQQKPSEHPALQQLQCTCGSHCPFWFPPLAPSTRQTAYWDLLCASGVCFMSDHGASFSSSIPFSGSAC